MSRFEDERYDRLDAFDLDWDRPTKAELDREAYEDRNRPARPVHPIVAKQIAELFPPIPCQDCGHDRDPLCTTCHPF